MSYNTWYIKGVWQGFAFWSSSQTSSYRIPCQWFNDEKPSQESAVNVEVIKLYSWINVFPVMHRKSHWWLSVILLLMPTVITTFYLKCDRCVICGNSQRLLLSLTLETLCIWLGSGFLVFHAGKTQIVLFVQRTWCC